MAENMKQGMAYKLTEMRVRRAYNAEGDCPLESECDECNFDTLLFESSLRDGLFCAECTLGYLPAEPDTGGMPILEWLEKEGHEWPSQKKGDPVRGP